MLSESLTKALSDQVNAEYYSAYLYLVMSAAADGIGLKGAANWLFVQAQEEIAHGTKMYKYILERCAAPSFSAIEQPPVSFASMKEIYDLVFSHEQKVSQRISSVATLAMQEFDHACYQFIMWYVNEQVEEEANVRDILDKLKMIGDNKAMLLTLDNVLATRVLSSPL